MIPFGSRLRRPSLLSLMFEIHIVISAHLFSIFFSPFTCSLNNGFANGYNNVNPQISAGNMGVTSISAQITSGRALVFVHFWSSVNPPSDITISSGSYVKLYDGKRNFGAPLYAMKIYKVTGINSGTFTVRANNVTENQCSIGIVSY